jgi:hypothetical protein
MPTPKTKKTTLRPRSQKIRTRTTYGEITVGGRLNAQHTYLLLKSQDGLLNDFIEGQRLYRLAKAIVTRFETAQTT